MTKLDEFIKNDCVACGGNWSAMLMSGIKNRFPDYFEKMEDRSYNFFELCGVVNNLLYPQLPAIAMALGISERDMSAEDLEAMEHDWNAFYKEPWVWPDSVAQMVKKWLYDRQN